MTPDLVVHVSPDGSDMWSGLVAVPRQDGHDGPLATLRAARDTVRRMRSGSQRPARVVVHGGTYRLTEPLRLSAEDSGVSWTAADGESPVLSGGRPVTGWVVGRHRGAPAWTVELGPELRGRTFRSLYVDGRRRERPTVPAGGPGEFLRIERAIDPAPPPPADPRIVPDLYTGASAFSTRPGDVPALSQPAQVEAVVTHYWVEERMPLVSYDASTRVARSTRRSLFRLVDDKTEHPARYYLDNVAEALARPGQWYLDPDAGLLTYLPLPGEEPDEVEVVAPLLTQLVVLDGVERSRFHGLALRHTDWEHVRRPVAEMWGTHALDDDADYATILQASVDLPGALHLERCSDVDVERCEVSAVGFYAVAVERGCARVTVRSSLLTDLGGGGVKANGAGTAGPETERTRDVTVEDCEISDGGHVFHSAVGVLGTHVAGMRVVHNEVRDLDYSGISLGWVWGYEESLAVDGLVEGNHVHRIGRGRMSDIGGIYTLGVSPGTVIRGNHVHGVRSATYGSAGIYCDQGSAHIVVEGNLVYDVGSAAFMSHWNREVVLRHNVLVGGEDAAVWLLAYDQPNVLTVERNVLVGDAGQCWAGGYAANPDPKAWPVTSDLNVLDGKLPDGWDGAGQDRHSLRTTDVLRSGDPLQGLADTSAAEQVGLHLSSWSTAGPRTPVGPVSPATTVVPV